MGGENFRRIKEVPKCPPLFPVSNTDKTIWIRPELVCVVNFMEYTSSGSMRQPVFKGLRLDKAPKECQI
ncbi:hypothetical protein [[Clostridium] symbiosum]|uniref:ATP dependent DNA ligase n=1 Tax=Clostridium symbiosum TaxID=1512 RepID=UPI0034A5C99A